MARFQAAFPYGFLLGEVLVFHWKVLFSSHWGIPWDLRGYHLALASFVANSFQRGEFPLWDPFTYCGVPFYANMQAQVYYPPTIVTVFFSNLAGGRALADFLEWQVVLHVFLAGVFAYWLMRRLGVSTAAALAGATVFLLGGYFASQTQHLGAMDGAAWLPLAWLGVVSLGSRFSWRWLAVLAIALAMSILAGFPAISFVAIASSLLLALVLALFRQASWRTPLYVLFAYGWALLLAAAQLGPSMELTALSVARFRTDWIGTGGGLPVASLVSLVLPNYYNIFDLAKYSAPWNPTFLYVYCGVPALLFAIRALALRRGRYTKPALVLAGVCLVWMLGDATPPVRWGFQLLPDIVKASVYFESAMAAFVLSMAVLTGLAADDFLSSKPRWAGGLVLCVVAADLILVGSGRPMNCSVLDPNSDFNREEFEGQEEILTRIRALTRSPPPARIDTVDDSMNWAIAAPAIEIPTANGNDPMALIRRMQVRLCFTGGERWGRYYQVSNPDSPVLALLNVRCLLSRSAISSSAYRKVAQIPGRAVYENDRALSRFFLVGRVIQAADMHEAVSVLRSAKFDPWNEAVVEGQVSISGPPEDQERSVRVVEYQPTRVVLETNASRPAFLVTSETYYPGWRAFINGAESALVPANVAFRGLPVPGGHHRIEMRFEPRILWVSLAASLLGWALAAAVLWFGDNGRKRGSWISSSN